MFSEIRSLKRIERTHESVGTTGTGDSNKILDTIGIIDPTTGRTLTVGEAIQMRILDVRTGEIVINTKGERISVQEAVQHKLIDPKLASSLLEPGAAHDSNGRPISLLEVIQKEILEAENGYDTTEKRIKVTRYNEDDELDINNSKVKAKSIADAINDGIVDSKSGLYRTESGTLITITEAYERGFLVRHETIKIKSNALCLSDAIVHGLVDTSGWVIDRNSGDKFRLDSAIANGLINPDIQEVVDAKNDLKVTLQQALETGILNAKTGRYMQTATKEKLTFIDAKQRQLICKPLTLKDVCDLNMLEKSGKIFSPTRRSKLSIIEAMNGGVLDSDTIKSISVTRGELVTLAEALAKGVILPESKYRVIDTAEVLSIPDAVDRGLISSVSQRSIFNIDGFKEPYSGDFISLNQALSKNILRRKSGAFKLDSGKGNLVSLENSVEDGFVRPEVFEMLNRKIGVINPYPLEQPNQQSTDDDDDDELSVLDLVYFDLIDPKTGYLLDPTTKAIVPLDHAIENKFITPEGALLLSSLLNITLTTETVTKTIKRYVTITGDLAADPAGAAGESTTSARVVYTFTEAVRQGLIDEKNQSYTDPATGKLYSIQQALNYGLIAPDTDAPPSLPTSPQPIAKTTTITIVHKSVIPEEPVDVRKTVHSNITYEPVSTTPPPSYSNIIHTSEIKTKAKSSVTEFLNAERHETNVQRQELEMPAQGWFLSEAIKQKLFDTNTGLFIIPGTDRLVSFEECIKLQIINPESVSVIDPHNDRKIHVLRSFEKRILDATGNYKTKKRLIGMTQAIRDELIILEQPSAVDSSSQRLIQIIKTTGKPDRVEVASKDIPATVQAVRVASQDLPSPEPVQMAPGVIYDPSTALVIFTETGVSESIITAVYEGNVDPNLITVIDPKTGNTLNAKEAMRLGVINSKTHKITDNTGKSIDLIDAVKFGLLVVAGTPLVAAAGAINSLRLILDPKTGEQIPIELAYERGIVSKDAQLVRDPKTGEVLSLEEATSRGLVTTTYAGNLSTSNSQTVIASITDPRTGETMDLDEAVAKGLLTADEADKLLNSDPNTIPDPNTGENVSIAEAVRRGLLSPTEANALVAASENIITNTTFQIQRKRSTLVTVKDPKTGEEISVDEAIRRGLLTVAQGEKLLATDNLTGTASESDIVQTLSEAVGDTGIFSQAEAQQLLNNSNANILIKDPITNEKITLADALQSGLINQDQAKQLLVAATQASGSSAVRTMQLESISLTDDSLPSQREQTRSRITTEPTFQVAIGRARSFSQSPEKEAKPVVLQKMRKKIVRPKDALDKGIIDEETAAALDNRSNFVTPSGEPVTLGEVVAQQIIDGSKGKIVDPQRGDVLNINEAIRRGILDADGTNQVLVPLNKTLSVPQLADQGLIDVTGTRIVHPETGTSLSLKDAIVCEIVDPFSELSEPTGQVVTLESAIQRGCVDDDASSVLTRFGSSNLLAAIKQNIFHTNDRPVENMPLLGMTFPVALKRDLIDLKAQQVIHPITKERISIADAIDSNFIMALPYTPSADAVSIHEAIAAGLIEGHSFKNLATNELIPISEAIETGLLVVKPLPELVALHASGPVMSRTETVTSYHTITTKTVELLTGYVLSNSNEVRNVQTGERFTVDQAKELGIIKGDTQTQEKFATRDIKVNFSDAIQRGLVDIRAGTYTDPTSGTVMPIQQAVDDGILATQTSIDDADEDSTHEDKVEMLTLAEAVNNIYDEQSKQFRDPKNPERLVTFTQAMQEGIVDAKSVVYDIETGKTHTLEEGVKDGFIDPKTGEVNRTSGGKINVKDAAKLGLLAVVGAPILAGMAVASVVKKVVNKIGDKETPDQTPSPARNVPIVKPTQESLNSKLLEKSVIDGVKKPIESDKKPIDNDKKPIDNDKKAINSDKKHIDSDKKEIDNLQTTAQLGKQKTDEIDKAVTIESFIEPIGSITKLDNAQELTVMSAESSITTVVSEHFKSVSIEHVESLEIQGIPNVIQKPERIHNLENIALSPTAELIKEISESLDKKKAKSPEKHVTFEFTSESTEQQQGERMLLGEAISQKKINQLICRIVYKDHELDKTVQTALDHSDIALTDEIEVLAPNLIVLLEKDQTDFDISITDALSAEQMQQLGAYDFEAECFVDPATGDRISFSTFMYDLNIVDPDLVYVKDLSTGIFDPLDVALDRPLIDKHTGHMVDSKTGKRIPFFECIERGWIIQKPAREVEVVDLKDATVDAATGAVLQEDGTKVSISEAINSGMIDVDHISLRDPTTGEIIPMTVAIERGIVDLKRGIIIDSNTQKEVSIATAFAKGDLIAGLRKPISLKAVVNQGLYDPSTGTILDSIEQVQVDLAGSIEKGIVDPSISLIRDTKRQRLTTLTEAIEENIADPSTGTILDTAGNRKLTLDAAIAEDILSSKPTKWDLLDVLSKQYYDPVTGKILNPMTGEQVTLSDAIADGFVDVSAALVKDEARDKVMPASEAITIGLIDANRGMLTRPELTLDTALQKGYLLSNKKPLSIVDALIRNLYDPQTGLLTIDGETMTLEEAIAAGIINTNDLIVRDPETGSMCSLLDAIRSGIINPKMGLFIDPHTGLKLSLVDALDRGLLLQSKRKCSLPDAVFKGLYDPKSGTFSSTITSEKLSTDRAIKRGIIDPQSTIVNVNGKVLPFELAVENGIVNARRGTVVDDYGNKIDFREAFDRGILIEVKKPISLAEALLKGLYDVDSGLFMDPKTGQRLTIAQSLARKLIDPNSVQMKDLATGLYKDISLFEATESGLINGQNAQVLFGNDRISLQEAFDTGLLSDSKAPISIQRAIHQGLYDEKTGKLHDPISGRKITLFEAIRKFIVNPQLPCYFNERDEQLLSLAETCRSQLIDRREGVFKEPGSDVFIPLNDALALGLIVDIENAGFGLYEALAMGMYDKDTKRMIHPVSNRKLTVRQAHKEDLINSLSSLIKVQETGKYVKLDEAIKLGIINDEDGVYQLPKYVIDLQEARQRGLIVTNQKQLSIEKAVKNQLFRPDTGKFVDPSVCVYYDLHEAIVTGLIDPETTVFKNLQTGEQKPISQAIAEGDIDVTKGRVLDPKTKRSYNFDVALSNGLLVTVDRPLTGRSLLRRESLDVLTATSPTTKTPREMSLDEAIRYEIINPHTAVVKDSATGQFKMLQHRIDTGTVNLELRALVDPKSLFFTFDPTFIVYVREPLSFEAAIESKCLDLSTGKFIDPSEPDKVYALKDAIILGLIDPESALIKDGAKKKLIRLPEACRKGLVDADKANVLDTTTSKLYSLQAAVDSGLVFTPKRAICLLEALSYNLYNPTTGGFTDPFTTTSVIERRRLTLADVIATGHIDPSTTMVRDTENSTILPLVAAISSGLVDAVAGRLIEPDHKAEYDLLKARDRGLLLPAEQRVSFLLHHNDIIISIFLLKFLASNHILFL